MSRIEQIISDIEAYLDSCKFQPFSNTKLIVDKDQLEDYIEELKLKTPVEIKKYQKIIDNKDAIIKEAKEQADEISAMFMKHCDETEILKQISNVSGAIIPAPHSLRNILAGMNRYPQICQWMRKCIKNGTINEQSYRRLQEVYRSMNTKR